ncbi:uncharacterized protein [Clytia hemisphaerica]|uniref:uncharacterized protein isoform X2 n=1 Tax=Clytia hemisphaerica TaxID=252671 RepID=UPI0034D39B87
MVFYIFFLIGGLIPSVFAGKPSIVRKKEITNGKAPDGEPMFLSYINFAKFQNKMLVVGVPSASIINATFDECNEKCLEMNDCVSMNVYKENGTKCDLMSTDQHHANMTVLDVQGVDYYEPTSDCVRGNTNCTNNSFCMPDHHTGDVKCQCKRSKTQNWNCLENDTKSSTQNPLVPDPNEDQQYWFPYVGPTWKVSFYFDASSIELDMLPNEMYVFQMRSKTNVILEAKIINGMMHLVAHELNSKCKILLGNKVYHFEVMMSYKGFYEGMQQFQLTTEENGKTITGSGTTYYKYIRQHSDVTLSVINFELKNIQVDNIPSEYQTSSQWTLLEIPQLKLEWILHLKVKVFSFDITTGNIVVIEGLFKLAYNINADKHKYQVRTIDEKGKLLTTYKLYVDDVEREKFQEFTLIQQFDASLAAHVVKVIVNKNVVYVGKTKATAYRNAQLKTGVIETKIADFYMFNL